MGIAVSDTTCFSAHSTRSASASAATNLSTDVIMKATGWVNETTLNKFYKKPMEQSLNFGEHFLSSENMNK